MDMSEKPEGEEFEDDEVEELVGHDDVDLDRVNKDLDLAKRHAKTVGDPAWRRLERLREDKEFAELVSDFEDYDLDDTKKVKRLHSTAS
jgi:hypothetical protein